jgi:hypothetical protein
MSSQSRHNSRAAPAAPDSTEVVRLSINLAPAVAETIKTYSRTKGVSITEAVRRAINMLAYIDAAQERGASINIRENGALREIQFLA